MYDYLYFKWGLDPYPYAKRKKKSFGKEVTPRKNSIFLKKYPYILKTSRYTRFSASAGTP